jgi:hypothetical protein
MASDFHQRESRYSVILIELLSPGVVYYLGTA